LLSRDNTPTVVLGEWELQAEYFEDDFLSGVSPVLFANDPQASEAAIRANPEIAKKDLVRLNCCFSVPESVELDAALKIMKKARLGDVDYVFKRKNLDCLFEPVSFNKGKFFTKIHYANCTKVVEICIHL
jgi:hypothetical protein